MQKVWKALFLMAVLVATGVGVVLIDSLGSGTAGPSTPLTQAELELIAQHCGVELRVMPQAAHVWFTIDSGSYHLHVRIDFREPAVGSAYTADWFVLGNQATATDAQGAFSQLVPDSYRWLTDWWKPLPLAGADRCYHRENSLAGSVLSESWAITRSAAGIGSLYLVRRGDSQEVSVPLDRILTKEPTNLGLVPSAGYYSRSGVMSDPP